MATVVTVDGIFESIPPSVEFIQGVIPKIVGTADFQSSGSDQQFTAVWRSSTSTTSGAIKPDWRHPERKIG